MNCKKSQDLIHLYLDGELSGATAKEFENHLSRCSECRDLYDQFKALLVAAGELPKHIDPPPQVWRNIAAAIEPPEAVTRLPWSAVAGFVLVVTLALVTGVQVKSPLPDSNNALLAENVDRLADEADSSWAKSYKARFDDVQPVVYSPRTEAVVKRNLQIIDQALKEIHEAIAQDPNNPDLRALLQSVYQQENSIKETAERINDEPESREGI